MRFCIVTHKVLKGDGQGRVNYEVVKEAVRRGHQLTLVASSVSPDLLQSPLVQWVTIAVKGLPTELLKNLVFSQKSAAWLRQHRAEFDLIKVNGAITSAKSDVNAVHFVHSSWLKSPAHPLYQSRNYYGLYQWVYSSLNAYWERQAFQQARVIIAVSEKVKQELLAIGVSEQKIRVILNGVDLQEFHPGEGDRRQWQLPDYVPLALFAGDIRSNRKNLDTVLQSLVHIPELHLVVAGASENSPYPQLATSLGIENRVHFLGQRNDLPKLMRVADFFVFPSRYEPFGMVAIEAMASGLPVVLANTSGVAEVLLPECGIVLEGSECQESLLRSLCTLTHNFELRSRMGQTARSVAEQHSWSSKAKTYVDIFEELSQQ
jgi:glycosyltransferase involved in cell wall biosynthesis